MLLGAPGRADRYRGDGRPGQGTLAHQEGGLGTRAWKAASRRTHRFIVGELLTQIDGLDETIARFDAEIEKHVRPF